MTWIGRVGAILVALGVGVDSVRVRGSDDFPTPRDTEPLPGKPMAPAEAAAGFRVPAGFHVNVFAAEPEVCNPIGMTWDARGRLWVAENYTYAERAQKFDLRLRDRVIILEDRDHDGKADRRAVFTDTVQRLTSVEIGRDGIWLLCPPQLLFVPDRNHDDRPDGAAEVVLDGFQVPSENYHNFANGLKWGPDGWLYGRCGCSAPGRIGTPDATETQRIPLNGGLWRYHPARRVFETLTHGTTNPWGHDWTDRGEAFFINTVNGHLWHAVAGMHFVRPHTIDPNPYTYELIDQHADHWHWDHSKDWTDSRNVSGEHDRLGGGHAHSGMLIYNESNWPAAYRGGLFTLNMHGRRLNHDALERVGGGYVGRHRFDLLFATDAWFRGVELTAGPDGAVYLLDWSDTGECHESTGVHRSSGRIFRVAFGSEARPRPFLLDSLGARELARLQADPDQWYVRQSRRILLDRLARGEAQEPVLAELRRQLDWPSSVENTLSALWTLHALNAIDSDALIQKLAHPDESVRAWAVRLLTDRLPLDTIDSRRPRSDAPLPEALLEALMKRARKDPSALVRLVLASTLQRLSWEDRVRLAAPLLAHAEDSADQNIPLLLWYGLIPLGDANPTALATLAASTELPATRRLMARRLAEGIDRSPEAVALLLESVAARDALSYRADVLNGLSDGLRGRLKVTRPRGWDAVVASIGDRADASLTNSLRELGVLFGDGRAVEEVRRVALDKNSDMATRRSALESLIGGQAPNTREICLQLLKVKFLNPVAARGLARFDDGETARQLVENYRAFHPSERGVLLEVLVSRPVFARALLDRIASGSIPRTDLGAYQARQILALGDFELADRLREVWGETRASDTERRQLMASLKQKLGSQDAAVADPGRGRVVFERVCATCHTLYGRGADVGPDLTGAGRQDLDYLLENIVDPSANVSADFRNVIIALEDGRVLNGIVAARSPRTMTLRTPNGTLSIDRSTISEERATSASLMPDGLLTPLSEAETRDLFAYLRTRTQVPLPTGP